MHIVFDMTFPSQLKTGTRVYAYQLLETLQASSEDRFTGLSAPQIWTGGGIPGKALRMIWNTLWIQAVLPYELRQVQADLLFAPSFIAPLFLPCPLVLTIHDTAYLVHPEYSDALWSLYLRVFLPRVARKAEAVITSSQSSKRDIVRYYHVEPGKVHVIYYGVDSNFRRITEKKPLQGIRDKYGLNTPFLLFVGAQEKRKNIPRLVEALDLLRRAGTYSQHKLVLVGPRGKGTSEVERTIARLRLEEQVVFLGYISEEDLPLLYNAADLFAFPSLYEGFGFPLVEAMACGTPVVASNTSSIPEVARNAALLFDPKNSSDIAAQIHRVLSDDVMKQKMIEAGLQQARRFSWDDAAIRTMEVCRNVHLARHGQSAAGSTFN